MYLALYRLRSSGDKRSFLTHVLFGVNLQKTGESGNFGRFLDRIAAKFASWGDIVTVS